METLRGSVVRITYHNKENNFTVFKLKSAQYKNAITIIGFIFPLHVGSILTLYGEWKIDKQYGKQFQATTWEESLPATIIGIEKYLGSGLIKGVGASLAKKIVTHFKDKTFSIIEDCPEKLMEVQGINHKKVETIKTAWQEQKDIKNLILFLQSKNINTSFVYKIFKEYDENSIEIITKNPYRLADDIPGIGFKTADTLAENIGIEKESYIRCRSGLLFVLNEFAKQGHCYAEQDDLIVQGSKLLGIDETRLVMTLGDMWHTGDVIAENNHSIIYLPFLFHSESGVSKLIKEIQSTPREKQIKIFIPAYDSKYDDIQRESIQIALKSKFMVLTGGPGTGKTTTIKGIIEMFQNNGFKVILAAPTGRAAKRMTEATGAEAKTIHRLLEYIPSQGYTKNENNPLHGDVLILDECSMIDIVLIYNLLKAVPKTMSIIMAGDKDQLPSVQAGNVFGDIIEGGRVPVVKLEKIYRQAGESNIIQLAHKVNHGNPISDIHVLSPVKNGLIGTNNLNLLLQSKLNSEKTYLKRAGLEYYLHDKVMQITNNYDKMYIMVI